jgi:hypothetical protein
MSSTADSRNHQRLPLDFEVEYSVLSGFDKLNLIQSRTLDFSLTGTRIHTSEKLNEGDQISVRIEVPDLQSYWLDDGGNKCYNKTVVMCFGVVRWVNSFGKAGYEAGIEFSGMTTRDRAYLSRLFDESPVAGRGSAG